MMLAKEQQEQLKLDAKKTADRYVALVVIKEPGTVGASLSRRLVNEIDKLLQEARELLNACSAAHGDGRTTYARLQDMRRQMDKLEAIQVRVRERCGELVKQRYGELVKR
jgi:hypothetical protein